MACSLSNAVLLPSSTSGSSSLASSSWKQPYLPKPLKPRSFVPCAATAPSNGNGSQAGDAIQHQRRNALQQSRRPRDSSVLLLDSWDPFSRGGLRQMMDTMDSLFLDDWSPLRSSGMRGAGKAVSTAGVRAPWDVVEDEETYHVRVDMPGFDKDDVKVVVEDGVLVVAGERDPSKEDSRWAAKSFSKFNTRLALPDDAQVGKITAEMKNGVLCVSVPKVKPEEKRHVVNVDVV